MSRHIQTANPENRKLNNTSEGGKLILTRLRGRAVSLLLQKDQLITAQVIPEDQHSRVGEVYIGKVKNIVPNINACFVEIADGQICYMPLPEAAAPENMSNSQSSQTLSPKGPLKEGDELPVQIIRDAIKTKQAAVTTAIELDSEYFVFKAGEKGIGVSSKIEKKHREQIRKKLEQLSEQLSEQSSEQFSEQLSEQTSVPSSNVCPQNSCLTDFCVIARTKCQELQESDLIAAYTKQREEFLAIFEKAAHRTCYSCILRGPSPVINAVNQIPYYEYGEIITDIPEFYHQLQENAASFSRQPGSLKENLSANGLRFYEDDSISLSSLYGLQTRLDNALQSKVWMPSGANLVIEQTECLTAIDVNSSKNIKGKIAEDVIFQINLEAASEAARQIRLRNLSGIIIIDFINMKNPELGKELLEHLRTLTARDPITTRVVDMTPLGLVEVTRKKINMSFKEQMQGRTDS